MGSRTEKLIEELRDTNRLVSRVLRGIPIESTFKDASVTMATARRIVKDSEQPLSRLIAALGRASENIDALTQRLDAGSKEVPEAFTHLRRSLRRLDKLLSNRQQDLEISIENIRVTTENLREMSEKAKTDPSILFFRKSQKPPQKTGKEK